MMFQFGEYTLDIAQGCLRTADREVDLRPKSFDVLRCLVENVGRWRVAEHHRLSGAVS